jgi:prepilin-type processing-associated H-X9-DG protein
MKQIGLSLRLYSGDFSERFPCDATATTLGSFGLLTNKYQTSYKTWVCPSDPGMIAGAPVHPWTSTNLSYAYGGFGLTEKTRPDTPLACDRSSDGNPTGKKPWARNQWTHKSDGGNVLFVDGCVAFQQTMPVPMYRGKNP